MDIEIKMLSGATVDCKSPSNDIETTCTWLQSQSKTSDGKATGDFIIVPTRRGDIIVNKSNILYVRRK